MAILTAEEAIAYINEATSPEDRRNRKSTVFHAIYGVNMAKDMQQHLIVERTVKLAMRVPFDENHYPEMSTVQAIDYELQLPRAEKLQLFVESLEIQPANEVELTERVYLEK